MHSLASNVVIITNQLINIHLIFKSYLDCRNCMKDFDYGFIVIFAYCLNRATI
jgi:hypothetical protein